MFLYIIFFDLIFWVFFFFNKLIIYISVVTKPRIPKNFEFKNLGSKPRILKKNHKKPEIKKKIYMQSSKILISYKRFIMLT